VISIVKKEQKIRRKDDKKEDDNKERYKKEEVQASLKKLLQMCEAAAAVLAVTTDGHLICQFSRNKQPLKRLAAMSSTLMSLGDTITDELSMGRCENIISENEFGIVLFTHWSAEVVLVALTQDRSSLGMLLSSCRVCVSEINGENNNVD
jgi:predicted regulator of Ras-like GTPase activity (Roadblock/LC7/MglB family)